MSDRIATRDAQRIVVKVGSSVLTDAGAVRARVFSSLASQVAELLDAGRQVVLVSSGAIAVGSRTLGWSTPGRSIPEKQAAAAVGQPGLIALYQRRFARRGREVGQVLVTRSGLQDRERFLHARHTLTTLLGLGVVPIVNENDTVATDEIRFGDNDNLSATVVNLVGADLLVLLTDVDGLYRTPPDTQRHTDTSARKTNTALEDTEDRSTPTASASARAQRAAGEQSPEVPASASSRAQRATGERSPQDSASASARAQRAAGERSSNNLMFDVVPRITPEVLAAAGGSDHAFGRGGMITKLEAVKSAALSGAATVICNGRTPGVLGRVAAGEAVGTLFLPGKRLRGHKHWLAFTAQPRGELVLDAGAAEAVASRGKSLLPAGIREVRGRFGIGDAVLLLSPAGDPVARGLTAYTSPELERIQGLPTRKIPQVLGYSNGDAVVHRDDLVLVTP